MVFGLYKYFFQGKQVSFFSFKQVFCFCFPTACGMFPEMWLNQGHGSESLES